MRAVTQPFFFLVSTIACDKSTYLFVWWVYQFSYWCIILAITSISRTLFVCLVFVRANMIFPIFFVAKKLLPIKYRQVNFDASFWMSVMSLTHSQKNQLYYMKTSLANCNERVKSFDSRFLEISKKSVYTEKLWKTAPETRKKIIIINKVSPQKIT